MIQLLPKFNKKYDLHPIVINQLLCLLTVDKTIEIYDIVNFDKLRTFDLSVFVIDKNTQFRVVDTIEHNVIIRMYGSENSIIKFNINDFSYFTIKLPKYLFFKYINSNQFLLIDSVDSDFYKMSLYDTVLKQVIWEKPYHLQLKLCQISNDLLICQGKTREDLACVNLKSGETIWYKEGFAKKGNHTDIIGNFQIGVIENVYLWEDKLIVAINLSYILAIDVKTGEELWEMNLEVPSIEFGFKVAFDSEAGRIHFFKYKHYYQFDASNGHLVLDKETISLTESLGIRQTFFNFIFTKKHIVLLATAQNNRDKCALLVLDKETFTLIKSFEMRDYPNQLSSARLELVNQNCYGVTVSGDFYFFDLELDE